MVGYVGKQGSNKLPQVGFRHILPYSLIFVVAPILTFAIGAWLDQIFHLPRFPRFPFNLCSGLSVFFFGLSIGIKSTRALYRLGRGLPWGELSQQAQSDQLVTTGLYACCRNPMTFGYSLLPCGMGLMFQSPGMAFLIPAMVFAVMIVWLKLWEEPNLQKRFGEAYLEYKRTTPFLIPRSKPLVLELLSPIFRLQQDAEVKRLTHYRLLSIAYLSVSLFGLCLLVVSLFSTPISLSSLTFWRQLTISCFGAICILGTIAGIYPSKCSSIKHFSSIRKNASQINRGNSDKKAIILSGHHPTCGTFSSHVILFRGKTYCAGCTGLVAGAIASLFGILLCFPAGLNISETGKLLLCLGSIGVACGLLQYELPVNKAMVHFLLNIMFVLGAFMLLISVSKVNNVGLNLFFLALTVYWIVARMMMSRFEHYKMCAYCGLASCSYSFH